MSKDSRNSQLAKKYEELMPDERRQREQGVPKGYTRPVPGTKGQLVFKKEKVQ